MKYWRLDDQGSSFYSETSIHRKEKENTKQDGECRMNKIINRFGEDIVNNNRERLIKIAKWNHMKILNGNFQYCEIHKYVGAKTDNWNRLLIISLQDKN